jgi:DNA-directed RNA polymerase subunit RPC12/RpoP
MLAGGRGLDRRRAGAVFCLQNGGRIVPDIRFNCAGCGQALEAPPEMSGETVECPSCGRAISVPAAGAASASPPGAGGVCPACAARMDPGAVLCLACGYHLKLGRKLETKLT